MAVPGDGHISLHDVIELNLGVHDTYHMIVEEVNAGESPHIPLLRHNDVEDPIKDIP
jgi:hypothetical protein